MPCLPTTELLMSVREGIEIGYCPQCRGVWLDRGELDQLIRRAEQAVHAEAKAEFDARREHAQRKKSFLGDLFDFD
ncbi:MAG: hypothetical protein CBHOC_3897 [uncultured Caballeronia sp.]|nr:MAG: hypothetical protein CBHOC_3897 [uncultured Caballeronia sp.]